MLIGQEKMISKKYCQTKTRVVNTDNKFLEDSFLISDCGDGNTITIDQLNTNHEKSEEETTEFLSCRQTCINSPETRDQFEFRPVSRKKSSSFNNFSVFQVQTDKNKPAESPCLLTRLFHKFQSCIFY